MVGPPAGGTQQASVWGWSWASRVGGPAQSEGQPEGTGHGQRPGKSIWLGDKACLPEPWVRAGRLLCASQPRLDRQAVGPGRKGRKASPHAEVERIRRPPVTQGAWLGGTCGWEKLSCWFWSGVAGGATARPTYPPAQHRLQVPDSRPR